MKTAAMLLVLLATPALADVAPEPKPAPSPLYGVAILAAGAFAAALLKRRFPAR